jgi:hypothetical protein
MHNTALENLENKLRAIHHDYLGIEAALTGLVDLAATAQTPARGLESCEAIAEVLVFRLVDLNLNLEKAVMSVYQALQDGDDHA